MQSRESLALHLHSVSVVSAQLYRVLWTRHTTQYLETEIVHTRSMKWSIMTNTYSRHVRKLDLRRRVKSVLDRLSSCSPGCAVSHSHEQVNCFRNHRIVTSRKNGEAMSIGCFGECSFGSDSSETNDRANHVPKVYCKFYPPIQTLLREKDPEKW